MAETEYPNMGANAQKAKKELRIEQIRRLMLRGIKSPQELQAQMKVMGSDLSLRTIHRYRGILSKRHTHMVRQKQGLNETVEELAIKLKDTIEEVSKELWVQYHAPVNMIVKCTNCKTCIENGTATTIRSQFGATVKVAALKEIKLAAQEWVKTLQSLGLTTVAPQQHQLLDANGKPIDPPQNHLNVIELSNDFTSFLKAKYQDPVGRVDMPVSQNQESTTQSN